MEFTLPSLIGHGAPGLRSNLRSFDDLVDDSEREQWAYVEQGLGKILDVNNAIWTADSGAYKTTFEERFDGVLLDVIAVASLTERLTRVESLAECQFIEGTFFYDVAAGGTVESITWDRDGAVWDTGTWDDLLPTTLRLYVHLTGGVSPSTTTLSVTLGTYYSNVGIFEPSLGPEKVSDGSFEIWPELTTLTYWNPINDPQISQSTAIKIHGQRSVKIRAVGGAGSFSGLESVSTIATVAGRMYRLSGWVYIPTTDLLVDENPGTPSLRIETAGSTYLDQDGRHTSSTATGFTLGYTANEWRRYFLDFVAPSSSIKIAIGTVYPGGGGARVVYADRISCQRIWRFNYHQPRVARGGLPGTDWGPTDIYPGSERIGKARVRLHNDGDRYFQRLFRDYDTISKPVTVAYGGRFADGQEVSREDAAAAFPGIVRDVSVAIMAADLAVEDDSSTFSAQIPAQNLDASLFANISPNDQGRPRAFLIGEKTNIRPARVSYDGTTFLPIYEVTDPAYNVQDLFDLTAVYVYTDAEAARRKDPARRVSLAETFEWDFDSAANTGRMKLVNNPGIIEVIKGKNDAVPFKIGAGGELTAYLTPGLYRLVGDISSTTGIIYQIATQMNAVGGGSTFTPSYSTTTHKLTFTINAGTFQFLLATGTQRQRSIFSDIGFLGTADPALAASQTSDTAIYDQSKMDAIVLRVDATGVRDNGNYTGAASTLIELGPDVTRLVLNKWAKIPLSRFDAASFNAGRTLTPQPLGIYFGTLASIAGGSGSAMTIEEFLARMEASCFVDIVMDRDGMIYWVPRPVGTIAIPTRVVNDRDLLTEVVSTWNPSNVYKTVRLTYDQDPTTGIPITREATNAAAEVRHGRPQDRTFSTFLRNASDADYLLTQYARIARRPVRDYPFACKGRLVKAKPTDAFYFGVTGRTVYADQMQPDINRVLRIKVDYLSHVCEVVSNNAMLID